MRYTVLLIITDGVAIDYGEAKRRLSVYSELPLSVIIVGVGRAEFTPMYNLVNFHGCCQKNATFLEFRNVQQDDTLHVKVALENIPSQIVEYMVENGIQPTGSG
jgi:predicted ThiF/HesA family dinucleotide-utilizing enzyme